MTAGYFFTVTCPQCGGEVDHVTSGVVYELRGTRAVSFCRNCRRRWIVAATFTAASPSAESELRSTYRTKERTTP